MGSPSNDETNTATDPLTSVATSTEPTMVTVEVTTSSEYWESFQNNNLTHRVAAAAERMITPSADRTDQVEEDADDDDDEEEEEEDAEDDDKEEEDEDMPKWDGYVSLAMIEHIMILNDLL
jgi:ribosomal protein L12E/L44/L45/RPP1/RPP2